jgi:tetratricopeptide (TPR) repeat protein
MSENLDYWMEKGKNLVKEMKFEEALTCWNKVLEIDSKHRDAWIVKVLHCII